MELITEFIAIVPFLLHPNGRASQVQRKREQGRPEVQGQKGLSFILLNTANA